MGLQIFGRHLKVLRTRSKQCTPASIKIPGAGCLEHLLSRFLSGPGFLWMWGAKPQEEVMLTAEEEIWGQHPPPASSGEQLVGQLSSHERPKATALGRGAEFCGCWKGTDGPLANPSPTGSLLLLLSSPHCRACLQLAFAVADTSCLCFLIFVIF